MSNHDDGLPGPRHRKPGKARRRGSTHPGRHLRLVPDPDRTPACGCPDGYHEYGAHAPGHRLGHDPDEPRPGAYPVEDLAGMSPSAAALLLHRATAEAEREAHRLPHIVITRDVETETVSYTGPFATGLEALTVATRFVEQNRAVHPSWHFTLTVAPIPGPNSTSN